MLAFYNVLVNIVEIPKSPNFAIPLAIKKTFCPLISRWIIFLSWQCLIARHICVNHDNIWLYVNIFPCYLYSFIFDAMSPPSAYYMIIFNFWCSVLYTYWNLIILGCESSERIKASRKALSLSDLFMSTNVISLHTYFFLLFFD